MGMLYKREAFIAPLERSVVAGELHMAHRSRRIRLCVSGHLVKVKIDRNVLRS